MKRVNETPNRYWLVYKQVIELKINTDLFFSVPTVEVFKIFTERSNSSSFVDQIGASEIQRKYRLNQHFLPNIYTKKIYKLNTNVIRFACSQVKAKWS